jgi:amino acid permease
MDHNNVLSTHGNVPVQDTDDFDSKPKALNDLPVSAHRPTIGLAAGPAHNSQDPLRQKKDTDPEKLETHSDHDTNLGHVSDVQNASKRLTGSAGTKKLNTTQTVIIFMTNEIGIGILSLPAALNTLGFFPGIVAIIGMGMLSLYTAYNLIQYWRKYPYMLNIVDYGRVLGGPWLEAVFAIGFLINMALISASAVVTISIGLNTVSDHATCTVAFTVVAAVAMWAMCVPHSMRFVSWASWPCTVSIFAAVMFVMIVLGVQGPRNAGAPLNLKAIGTPSFTEAVAAFLNIAFAFSGNQAFPTVLAEMENPSRDYPRAVTIEKCASTAIYCIVAAVVYALSGESVASPALGSLQPLMAKIAYGIIFVGLLGTGLVFGMTAARYLHVFFLHEIGTRKAKKNGSLNSEVSSNASGSSRGRRASVAMGDLGHKTEWAVWIFSVTLFWVVVWILANAIPVFSSLLNISAALLLSWFTWGVTVLFWFHLNWNGKWRSSTKKIATAAFNVFIMMVTLFMMVPGMYASISALMNTFATTDVNGAFTCADNSIL